MKVEKTERGFEIIKFKDIYDNDCSLQQSSIVIGGVGWYHPGSSAVWLGTEKDRMHLDKKLVKGIIKRLNNWLEMGSFKSCKRQSPRKHCSKQERK